MTAIIIARLLSWDIRTWFNVFLSEHTKLLSLVVILSTQSEESIIAIQIFYFCARNDFPKRSDFARQNHCHRSSRKACQNHMKSSKSHSPVMNSVCEWQSAKGTCNHVVCWLLSLMSMIDAMILTNTDHRQNHCVCFSVPSHTLPPASLCLSAPLFGSPQQFWQAESLRLCNFICVFHCTTLELAFWTIVYLQKRVDLGNTTNIEAANMKLTSANCH